MRPCVSCTHCSSRRDCRRHTLPWERGFSVGNGQHQRLRSLWFRPAACNKRIERQTHAADTACMLGSSSMTWATGRACGEISGSCTDSSQPKLRLKGRNLSRTICNRCGNLFASLPVSRCHRWGQYPQSVRENMKSCDVFCRLPCAGELHRQQVEPVVTRLFHDRVYSHFWCGHLLRSDQV